MTNADIVYKALVALGPGWHTTRDIMWQCRRDGWQMTTQKARNVCRVLYRQDRAYMLVHGKRYSFEAKRERIAA